jgi:hypothetical protein
MSPITITVGPDLTCPTCGAGELNNPEAPVKEWRWQIRPHKVSDEHGSWSQCLVCAGYYDKPLGTYTHENGDPKKGWFCT